MPANRDDTLMTGPKGQIASRTLMENRQKIVPGPVTVAPGLHCLMGINICNTQIVDAPEGLIVVDTGRSSADGEEILEWASRLSAKPIVAVVYSHSHYTFGTGPIIDRYPRARVVAHHKTHRNVMSSLTGIRRFMRRRAASEAARYLPPEGPDADFPGSTIQTPGAMAYVRPTDEIATDGQQIDLGGAKLVIHTRYPFDTNDTIFVWLPSLEAILHNHFASNFPNIYPIQGGRYRDPLPWIDGLDRMRAYNPKHIMSTHGYPSTGREACRDRLTLIRDALQFVHDQTVRGMNKHLTPDELVDFVRLPEALESHPDLLQTYGMVSNHVRGVYSGLAGWYNGDPATIDPPDPQNEAQRIVAGFGGPTVVLEEVRRAVANSEFRWAARLGGWLVASDPGNLDARNEQADALRRLGQHSTAWTMRNYYLTRARELEGQVQLREPERTFDTTVALQTEPGTFLRALGYRMNPSSAPVAETRIGVRFPDASFEGGIIIRNAVVERVVGALADPDVEVSCPRRIWIEYFDSTGAFSSIVDHSDVTIAPSVERARSVLSVFDG